MDDQDDSTGLSGWAWYEMGRMDTAASQRVAHNHHLVWSIFAPRPQYNPEVELQKANENILAWMAHSDELKSFIASRDAAIVRLQERNTDLQKDYDMAVKAYRDVSNECYELSQKVAVLEGSLEKLRKAEL